MASKAAQKPALKGAKAGKKRGKKDADTGPEQDGAAADGSAPAPLVPVKQARWGALEVVRPVVEPLAAILADTNVVLALLGVAVIWLWWTRPSGAGTGAGGPGWSSSARTAAYEEMWRAEEGELWRWLDSRVGASGPSIVDAALGKQGPDSAAGKRPSPSAGGEMARREVEEAIRITRERLEVLEGMVRREGETAT